MPQKRGRLRRPCLCLSARGIAAQKPDLFRMSRDSKMMELPPTGRRNYDSGTTQHQTLLRGRMKSTHFRLSNISFFVTASSPLSFSSGVTDRSRARWQTRSQSVHAEIRFSIQIRGASEGARIAVGFYGACSHLGKSETDPSRPLRSPSFLGIPEIPAPSFPLPFGSVDMTANSTSHSRY